MAQLLKGLPVATAITQELTQRSQALKNVGVAPTLMIMRVGSRPDDISYERGAIKRCNMCGVRVERRIFPLGTDQDYLLNAIRQVNSDPKIHGVLLFRPLPKHINESIICAALDPKKDMDGITEGSMAGIFSGSGVGHSPCTAQACMEILDHYNIPVEGKRAVVVGRSNVIGKPVAMLLLKANATVTICHTRTVDIQKVCSQADILIVAAGNPGTITRDHVSPGQTVLDVGINVSPGGRIVGDVDFEGVEDIVGGISPVPAGVGSVTTAVLAKHTIMAAEKAAHMESYFDR